MNRFPLRLCSLGLALLATSARAHALTFSDAWKFTFSSAETPPPPPVSPGVAHSGGKVFVTGGNTLSALDMVNGELDGQVTLDEGFCGGIHPAKITSVAAHGNRVAVAVANAVHTEPGWVLIFNGQALNGSANCLAAITVGANPDMLTFTPDGSKILVANEGEPVNHTSHTYEYDPEGSISVIRAPFIGGDVQTADFKAFNGKTQELIDKGVRIFGPNATVAEDLEPEHIAGLRTRRWLSAFGLSCRRTHSDTSSACLAGPAPARDRRGGRTVWHSRRRGGVERRHGIAFGQRSCRRPGQQQPAQGLPRPQGPGRLSGRWTA